MGAIALVTGGRRSGKSAWAQSYAESLEGPRLYIATAPVIDEEMKARIEAHKKAREGKDWETVEEQTDLAGALRGVNGYKTALVECVTLWLNNLMYEAERTGEPISGEGIENTAIDVLKTCRNRDATVIFVTNEVGWGVIPDNPAGRRFSDIAGRVNQIIAAEADMAMMVVCGVPVKLK